MKRDHILRGTQNMVLFWNTDKNRLVYKDEKEAVKEKTVPVCAMLTKMETQNRHKHEKYNKY